MRLLPLLLAVLPLLACSGGSTGGDTSTVSDSDADTGTGDVDPRCAPGPGPQACCDYVDGYNICISEFGAGNPLDTDTSGCDLVADENADYYLCLAAEYESGDCTTNQGWAAAVTAAAECPYP